MVTREKIKEISDAIVEKFNPEKIVLFGSFAWGKPTEESDVDLLVVKETSDERLERRRKVRKILSGFGAPIDVLVYTPSELEEKIHTDRNLFLEDIINNGTTLYAAQ